MKAIFTRLYEQYHHDLFNFLFYMVKNRNHVEDLVQEVYVKVLKSYQNFEGKSSEKTWLFSIARHVAIDWFRKQNRQSGKDSLQANLPETLAAQMLLPEELAVLQEDIRELYQCLDKCTQDQRIVLILRFLQDFSIKETAEVLGWTESKVKTTQHRAMKELRVLMAQAMDKEGMADASKL